MENHPKKKLLDLVREAIGRKHYSKRTEEAYIHWIKRYIFFHNKSHHAVLIIWSCILTGIGSGFHYCKQIKYTELLVIFYKNTNEEALLMNMLICKPAPEFFFGFPSHKLVDPQ